MKKTLISLAASTGALLMSAGVALAADGGIDVGEIQATKGFAANLGSVLSSLLSFVMALAALIVFVYLIWGGIQWITSGGDKSKTEEARNKITAAVIGLIVLAASYAILQIGLRLLGFTSIGDTFQHVKVIDSGNTPF